MIFIHTITEQQILALVNEALNDDAIPNTISTSYKALYVNFIK